MEGEQERNTFFDDPEVRWEPLEDEKPKPDVKLAVARMAEATRYRVAEERRRKRESLNAVHLRYARKRRYGVTDDHIERLLEKQGNTCAICADIFENRKFHVDHDHKTGLVRGLLCRNCNLGLGHFKDDIGSLELAIKYLDRTGFRAIPITIT